MKINAEKIMVGVHSTCPVLQVVGEQDSITIFKINSFLVFR